MDPLDIDGQGFDCDAYLAKLMKEKSLAELMDVENDLTQQVRALDSEMQALVYENYNKFIAATDTVRNMKCNFDNMESEMKKLMTNMDNVTTFSENVSHRLFSRKADFQRLTKANETLKQLESLLHLPSALHSSVQQKDYTSAVEAFEKSFDILDKYKDMPAFRAIYSETLAVVQEQKDRMKEIFRARDASAHDLATNVGLLLRLGERSNDLADEYLQSALGQLRQQLMNLSLENDRSTASTNALVSGSAVTDRFADILEFVDSACSSFLSNACLMITTWRELFPKEDDGRLIHEVADLLNDYLKIVENRFLVDRCFISDGGQLLVRALDRFYRRVCAAEQVLPKIDHFRENLIEEIINIAHHQVELVYSNLEKTWQAALGECRQQLASTKNLKNSLGVSNAFENRSLSDALAKLEQRFIFNIKSSLASLLQLTLNDLSFAGQERFVTRYGNDVLEELVVRFFRHVTDTCRTYCGVPSDKSMVSTTLLLVLCKLCLDMASSKVRSVFDLCQQQFKIADSNVAAGTFADDSKGARSSREVENLMKDVAQKMLDQFVFIEGSLLSQLIIKSVQTRDWMVAVEPRSVRPVLKRLVEDLTAIDFRVGQLFEDGARRELSSDSSRRTSAVRGGRSLMPRNWTSNPASAGDSTLNNTLSKLWLERIDYYSSVEFTKVSVMTAIIKICLKALLETVRLRTFRKFGLQQMQVDCHYLQLYLWRFVVDENLVYNLLEEVVSSTVQRSVDLELMEPTVVNLICERG